MIIDKLEHSDLYSGSNARIKKAFDFLKSTDFSKVENGKYEIDSDQVMALVQRYDTRTIENGKWEAHQNYLDIQCIFEGSEKMGYANLDCMTLKEPYNSEKDVLFLDGEGSFVTVSKGMFTIFFPQDVHMPNIAIDNPAPMLKVVMKVKI